MDMIERIDRLRDSENLRLWRLGQMTVLGRILESFAPSPPSAAEINYYVRTFDTDGIPYVVKAQRKARNQWWGLGPLPPSPTSEE